MLVTLSGIVIDSRLSQLLKQLVGIAFKFEERVTDVSFPQPKNALSPMLVTLSDITADSRKVH